MGTSADQEICHRCDVVGDIRRAIFYFRFGRLQPTGGWFFFFYWSEKTVGDLWEFLVPWEFYKQM